MSNVTITLTSAQHTALVALGLVPAPATKAPARKASKARKAPARKAPAKKVTQPKADAPATKGSRMAGHGTGMTKAAWNKTLATKARLAGRVGEASAYSLVMADWAEVQGLRAAGATPDEVLALFVGR